MSVPAIQVRGLGKLYAVNELRHPRTLSERLWRLLRPAPIAGGLPESLWALQEVSFEVAPGEVLGVGDAGFQEKCKAKIQSLAVGGGTVLFTSHDMASVERLCRRVLVLNEGRVAYLGEAAGGIAEYRRLAS